MGRHRNRIRCSLIISSFAILGKGLKMMALCAYALILFIRGYHGEYFTERVEEAATNYNCPVGEFPLALAQSACQNQGKRFKIACDVGGTLTWSDNKLIHLHGPLVDGDRVVIHGTSPDATWGKICLLSGEDEAMCMEAAWNGQNNVIKRYSNIGGNEQSDPDELTFPFVSNEAFNVTILVKAALYKGFVNEVDVFDFDFSQPGLSVTTIRITGNVNLNSVIHT